MIADSLRNTFFDTPSSGLSGCMRLNCQSYCMTTLHLVKSVAWNDLEPTTVHARNYRSLLVSTPSFLSACNFQLRERTISFPNTQQCAPAGYAFLTVSCHPSILGNVKETNLPIRRDLIMHDATRKMFALALSLEQWYGIMNFTDSR